jgi:simple sugar transport system permease protein
VAGGQGFTAVMVSWLAQFNPFAMVGASLLIIFLGHGASEISTSCGLNQSFGDIITGIILFFIIGCEFFIRYRIVFRSHAAHAGVQTAGAETQPAVEETVAEIPAEEVTKGGEES